MPVRIEGGFVATNKDEADYSTSLFAFRLRQSTQRYHFAHDSGVAEDDMRGELDSLCCCALFDFLFAALSRSASVLQRSY